MIGLGSVASAHLAPADDEGISSAVVAGPGAFQAGYATPVSAVAPLGGLTFHNLDVPPHNVVALDATGPDENPWCDPYPTGECPAFWSELVGAGETAEVVGVDALDPGTYEFYCTVHPWMTGTLLVPPGVPAT